MHASAIFTCSVGITNIYLWSHSGAPHHCSSSISSSPISSSTSSDSTFALLWSGFAHGATTTSSEEQENHGGEGIKVQIHIWARRWNKFQLQVISFLFQNLSPDVKMLHGQLFSHIFTWRASDLLGLTLNLITIFPPWGGKLDIQTLCSL